MRPLLAALVLAVLALGAPAEAPAHPHSSQDAGHPIRIAAHALYPVGWLLDVVIFRPLHWISHHEPFHTVLGVERLADEGPLSPAVAPEREPLPERAPSP